MIEILKELNTEQEDILSLLDTAKNYWGKAHIILPKNWVDEIVRVALDDKRDSTITTSREERFGNGSHITMNKELAGKRIFVERVGKPAEEKRKKKEKKT